MKTYTLYSRPENAFPSSHGWLCVPLEDIPRHLEISRYSYVWTSYDKELTHIYLEQDEDAPRFLATLSLSEYRIEYHTLQEGSTYVTECPRWTNDVRWSKQNE